MRFVLAIVSFVLALVLMGWGVAQQTIFASPDEVAASGETTGDAPVTVIDRDTSTGISEVMGRSPAVHPRALR